MSSVPLPNRLALAQRLRTAREGAGMSVAQAAQAARVSIGRLRRFECCATVPKEDETLRLCGVYGMRLSELPRADGEPEATPRPDGLGEVAAGFADDITNVCINALRPSIARLVRGALAELRLGPCNCCGVIVQWRGDTDDEICAHCYESMDRHIAMPRDKDAKP